MLIYTLTKVGKVTILKDKFIYRVEVARRNSTFMDA